ncbi:hypothetical protein [Evansella cellulosilytica]|uniref:Uncharacterized protein n=1 Tax=Evansella cellulosilytica (strain ATCC 21833 / DSM 2522 / FERM P-1141 / JCM 9156 / N-4) TaxID=649639 RepID=E6TZC8_EVAC2|nr:hypothetical protein [Evansella cellulosilytica]ADU28990.1 hypothetical protein Bcell_0708 [Evansella cellulosilytica DSM 2522]
MGTNNILNYYNGSGSIPVPQICNEKKHIVSPDHTPSNHLKYPVFPYKNH